MVQNRNKLIDLLIGNTANVITHRVLEKAIQDEDIAKKYFKEIKNSLDIASKYREKINPIDHPMPLKDAQEIKERIMAKVKGELSLRISRGYQGINLALVEVFLDEALTELKIIN